ncbi:hypothetical protein DICVIV_07351 [Dictyocaulus viviparus]|uniref:Aminopeptidase N-like N-terminal domain-containing protein n=1 Tax=Dictyocaulus viviparus TaxID=29172 RepID=A0A0D8XPJ2_DICVI|nr:hypothetical protein DICVIV_07351 [Dictyocaulus viviparus]
MCTVVMRRLTSPSQSATWSSSRTSAGRSSAGVCVTVMTATFMLLFGVILGAVIHAMIFCERGSPLSPPQATLTTTATFGISSTHSNSSELSDYSGANLDTSTEIMYDITDYENCKDFPWNSVRLPRDVIPLSYNLTIHPNITTKTLDGSVTIDIKILNTTRLIVLNTNNIVMTTFSLSVNSKRSEAELYTCSMLSQWAFVIETDLHADDIVELGIEFNGKVLPDLHGLYISTHTDAYGKRTQSAVTQFEPSYARKMFPCFDEPNFKATFQLSVIREAHHVVRSNSIMKISKEHIDG